MWWLRQLLAQVAAWGIDPEFAGRLVDLARMPDAEAPAAAAAMFGGGDGADRDGPRIVNGVAFLSLSGLLLPGRVPSWLPGTSTEQVAMQFLSALDNDEVREIVIRCNSPGGSAAGTGELSDLIYRSRGTKPITGWTVNGACASAAYVILSACDRMIATTSSQVGSIGVMLAVIDQSKGDERWGERWEVLRIPALKGAGHPHEPLSEEARAGLMTSIVEPTYREMVDRIARNRGVSADTVASDYGRGLTLVASAALRASMIDGVGDWNDYIRQLAGHPDGEDRSMKWTARMKALLLAAGLVDDANAADGECNTALRAWCAARGCETPQDEAGVVALFPVGRPAQQTPPPAAGDGGTGGGTGGTGGANPQQSSSEQIQAAVQQALAAERTRQHEIRESATLLGIEATDPLVTAAMGDSAITPAAFSHQLVASMRDRQTPVGRVQAGAASLDQFSTAAVDALLLRAGPDLRAAAEAEGISGVADPSAQVQQTQAVREIAGLTLMQIAEEAVRTAGIRTRDRSPEAIAQAFLSMAGPESYAFARGHRRIDGGIMAADPVHGPGDYPNLMAGLANKIVDWSASVARVTYYEWGYKLDDLPDFNARQILQLSGVQEFDERPDGHEVVQTRFAESGSWIARDTYAQGLKLTPRMIVGGLLSEFIRGLVMLQIGHERTVNRLAINLLMLNPVLPIDGVALFAGAHNNQILGGAGGGPGIAQNNLMRTTLAQQPAVGDTEEAGLEWTYALYGSNWLNQGDVFFDPMWRQAAIGSAANAMTTVNLAAGRVRPLYDPMLSAGGNMWYGVADKWQMLGMVYAFGTGYGPGGQRLTYFKPETKSQHYDFEGSFGAALVNFQPFVQNAGQ
jgi:ClpP class serine protease